MKLTYCYKLRLHLLVLLSLFICVDGLADDLSTKIANREQLTDVPTIYLTILDVSDIEKDLVKDRTTNTAEYHDATIQVVDNSAASSTQHLASFTDAVQIKVRGNSTASAAKKPFRLKFAKDETDASGNVTSHKHDLLGYGYSVRNWVLMANYYDKSMIRNALTYHLGKYLGMPFCPGYKFVDLVINDEYRGTYQVSDQIEAGKNRVNIDEDNDWMLETVSWTSMLDPDYGIAAGTQSSSDASVTLPYNTNVKNPEPETTADWATLQEDVITWESAWNKSFQSSSKTTGWQAYNDVETFIKFYLAMNISFDYDGFFVMKGYRTPDGPFYWGPIWDKDLAYGNYGAVSDPESKLTEEIDNGMFHWNFLNYLKLDKTFVSKVKIAFDQLITDGVCDKLCNDVDNLSSLINETQALNYSQKWTLTGDNNVGCQNLEDYSGHATQLKNFLTKRFAFLKTKFDKMYEDAGCGSDDSGDTGGDTFEPTSSYSFTNATNTSCLIPASAFSAKATSIKVTLTNSATGVSYWGFYGYNGSEWGAKNVSGTTDPTVVITITDAADIKAVAENGIRFQWQSNGSIGDVAVTVENTIPECTSHDYSDYSLYVAQADGTYHAICKNCEYENTTETYYCFTVYPESATSETVYAKSWTPSADHPNSVASVKITAGLEANILNSYNVYNSTKNAEGNQICPDFRLTDGHPYYSQNKFVATKATYTRLLDTDEEYGTIILPYKYQNASNNCASFYHISSVSGNTMYLKAIDPNTEGDASAYTPVVFKRTNGANNITVTGTNITVKKSSANKVSSTLNGWMLTGVMEQTTVAGDTLYQIADAENGKIEKVSSVNVEPFRAYFSTTSGATGTFNFAIATSTATGDVNNDGRVDIADLAAIIAYLKGVAAVANQSAADIDGNGSVTKSDVDALAQKILTTK